MKKTTLIVAVLMIIFIIQSCGGVKVVTAWKAEDSIVDLFKEKKILVIARTTDNQARVAFEHEFADALRKGGLQAIESYTQAPQIHPEREMTEERMEFIRSILDSEGFNAILLTVVKDKKLTETTTENGIYMGAGYGYGYPGYYGGFHSYYRHPYAYGPYYSSFGGYIPTGTTTSTTTEYVLETVAYNLDEATDKQLVAVVTTALKNPKDAYKTADKTVYKILESLRKV
ncbi:hypothetical protein [Algibacter mikhailovii]|uniref:DUF4136 domain-containing protein n=1 Tax=Algibacter mikhailovii TaxID=425498 RepID=A0A918VEY8_9FLAO|nr:hypothetical protein [Algibacter mikhailovii]GGZ91682.1 hypothetical protein GCM10007028_32610 [Algibacter mikhailovii]